MEKRKLGNSDMEITPIGLGTWAIGGGGWEFAWGPQDDSDSIAAIREGIDLGLNWIDTAAVYGLGHSEEIVAKALEGRTGRPYVFTKCSMVWNQIREIDHSLKAASIRRECELSLRRLRVDVIDLYQIHWPLPVEDIEEGWETLARLQEEGKVRYIGVSNFDVNQMQRALRLAPITSLQPPYSLLARQVEGEILPFARKNNIGVIAYSPLYSGLLSGKMTRERIARLPQDDWRKHNRNFNDPLLSHNLRLVELLRDIGLRHGLTAAEVAISWTLSNPAVTGSIVGVRKPQQMAELVGSVEFRLSSGELREIARAQQVEAAELSYWAS